MTRKYQTRITGRACENFGAVNYTITETITERDGGLHVETHACGTCEGERVNERSSKFWPDVTLARAEEYRLRNGYVRIL